MANKKTLDTMQDSQLFFNSALFRDVQMAELFTDSKTFADAIPKQSYAIAVSNYEQHQFDNGFNIKKFITNFFELPAAILPPTAIVNKDLTAYFETQWETLKRPPDLEQGTSLIPLRKPYIVPGGRFREIYYWDSYFTSVGLVASGRIDLVKSMIENFVDIQDIVGLIPNGNRSYYSSRTQPPVLALMLALVLENDPSISVSKDSPFFCLCLDAIESEYALWMDGAERLQDSGDAYRRVVKVDDYVLNRFCDDSSTPRPESYREDVELAASLNDKDKPAFFRAIRSACESGWDFSSRWFENPSDIHSIHTTDIVPIDLNALIFYMESNLSSYHKILGNDEKARFYSEQAKRRAAAINQYLWNKQTHWFHDYDFVKGTCKQALTLAGTVPLFVELCDDRQAEYIHQRLMQDFLKVGGLSTSLVYSGQQWDSPNGWAPLHYFACKGLEKYGYTGSSTTIKTVWLNTVKSHFNHTHSVFEKYDVLNPKSIAGGGEYEVQEGFGWTNGVTVAFQRDLDD